MNNAEAVNWLINITADIWKMHQDLWHYEQALSEIRKMLEDASTIESEPHWIPRSERLPDIGTEVLVTDCEVMQICSLFESPDPDDGRYQWEDNYGHWYEFDRWDAWMPLPEPYKRGEQNK